ncbi:DUF1772 domain-containing protein [Saccharothrix xinjiangensis]|uniref:DUF1772 domain-containing protein n=1 Tax=Saccharothrix xinjiangensis TaxID=204798 RepID=A0ABV9XWV8_9PSEU
MTILAALGCGAAGGVFFAFSAMVMPALRRVAPAEGVAVMRAVNVVALNPPFLGLFLGTAVLSALAAFEGDPWARVGAGLYLLGAVVLTVAFHVPRNQELERTATPEHWARFLREWVPGNHVRALASLAAAAAFIVASLHQ